MVLLQWRSYNSILQDPAAAADITKWCADQIINVHTFVHTCVQLSRRHPLKWRSVFKASRKNTVYSFFSSIFWNIPDTENRLYCPVFCTLLQWEVETTYVHDSAVKAWMATIDRVMIALLKTLARSIGDKSNFSPTHNTTICLCQWLMTFTSRVSK